MKVLLFSDVYAPSFGRGGMANYVRWLAIELAKRGHDVQVVAADSSRISIKYKNGVKVIRAPHSLSPLSFLYTKNKTIVSPVPDICLLKVLRKVNKKFDPDFIHAHGWTIFTAAALKHIYFHKPVISTLHDYGFFCPTRTYFNEETKEICRVEKPTFNCISCAQKIYGYTKALAVTSSILAFRKTLNSIDRVIAVSTFVAKIAQKAGLQSIIIPNFIDLEKFQKTNNKNCPSVDVLYVGALTPYKGINVLLKATRLLKSQINKNISVMLIGPHHINYPMKINDPNVIILGSRPRKFILSQMKNAKVIVIPPISPETFGLVTLEAMASKRPVIASAIGGLTDIVQNNKTGLLIPPNDHIELTKAIKYLLERPMIAQEMGITGYHRVLKYFSARKVIPRLESVYKEVSK